MKVNKKLLNNYEQRSQKNKLKPKDLPATPPKCSQQYELNSISGWINNFFVLRCHLQFAVF